MVREHMIKQKAETKKVTFSELFAKNNAVISISIDRGFANISFDVDYGGKYIEHVAFLDDEGRPLTDECGENGASFDDIQKVANFILKMKQLRLDEMSAVEK